MLDYIEARLHETITLDEIAAYACVSQPQLYRLFQANTGHPVKEYIRKRKISEAARMISETGHSLTHIAQAGGFDSFQSFAKLFKKCTGFTPSQYRAAAGIYYSFEPIRLTSEDEQATVKITTLPPMRILACRYFTAEPEQLEPGAFQSAYREAIRLGWNGTQTRFFGHNCDPPFTEDQSDPQHAYRMMLVPPQGEPTIGKSAGHGRGGESNDRIAGSTWEWETFPGGLYAVTSTAFGNPEVIVRTWNRLLSDWLPSSKFSLADGPFLEEFISYRGKAARLHLYMPVRRRLVQPFIRIVNVGIRRVAFTRAYGNDAQQRAEASLTDWICRTEWLQSQRECRYYMAYAWPVPESPCHRWWEAGFQLAADIDGLSAETARDFGECVSKNLVEDGEAHITESNAEGNAGAIFGANSKAISEVITPHVSLSAKSLGGGEYACLTTEVYGTMSGVVEQIAAWLERQPVYERDATRQWFVEYAVRGDQAIERLQVTCYVPVKRRERPIQPITF